jgi:hypothetical protein
VLEDFGRDRCDALDFRLGGEGFLGEALNQGPVREDLERRPRLPPASRDDVVLQLFEIDIAHLGENIAGELDGERSGSKLVVVRVVRMAGEIGTERQIDRSRQYLLQRVVARDGDRESALVDWESILVEYSYPLEKVVVGAAAGAPWQDFIAQRLLDRVCRPGILDVIEGNVDYKRVLRATKFCHATCLKRP